MAARDTSIQAHEDHEREGGIQQQEKKILAVMKRGRDYSRLELSRLARVRLSSVCGRINRLVKLGRVAEAPIRECKITGRSVHPVFRVP